MHFSSGEIPVDTKLKINAKMGNMYQDPKNYCRLVGVLQYLTFTRPYIFYDVQHICLHIHDPCNVMNM